MRKAIYFLATGELLLLAALWFGTIMNPSDPAGQGMVLGFLSIAAVAVLLCLIPALLLARSENWRGLGVFLATLPVLVLVWLLTV